MQTIIEDNDIKSLKQFQLHVSYPVIQQIVASTRIGEKNLTKLLINLRNEYIKCCIREQPYLQTLIEKCTITYHKEAREWINSWLYRNKINPADLHSDVILIADKILPKRNTLIIQGQTNTEKSLLLRMLTTPLMPTTIPKQNNRSSFHLDQLPSANAVLFEEPYITPENVPTWKLLMEGAEVTTDIKNSEKEVITRIPIFISTSRPIDYWVDYQETEQLKQRYVQYNLNHHIAHYLEDIGTNIPPPPKTLTIILFMAQRS